MLRTAFARARTVAPRRHFVSTVLLTRSWETETVATLRTEAKTRGLSSRGNKATLITRLQEHDKQAHYVDSPTKPPTPFQQVQQARHASHVAETEVPGVPSSSEPPILSPSFPKQFLDVHLPDTNQPIPEETVQIPFVPDFWNSQRVKAESAPPPVEEPSTPTVISVAGDHPFISNNPSEALDAEIEIEFEPRRDTTKTTVWQDIVEDLAIPTTFRPPVSDLSQLGDYIPEVTGRSGRGERDYSRTLDKDEVRGVWVLVGLLTGSWLAAGIFQSKSEFAEKVEKVAEEVPKH